MLDYKTNEKYYPYGATSTGLIKNLVKGNDIKIYVGANGYTAYRHPTLGTTTVHRTVAELWIPNPNNLPVVNHIDFDTTNSNIENLEWVTYAENSQHAAAAGHFKGNGLKGMDIGTAKYTDDLIRCVCEKLAQGSRICDVAREFNIPYGSVKSLKQKKSRKDITDGYTFPKKENTLSDKTVHWLCQEMLKRTPRKEIIAKCVNKKVNINTLKNLRRGGYRHITELYFPR